MPTRSNQADIADQLGVSQMTVSRALRDDPRVRPALRAQIQALAERLGYLPHGPATAMRRGRHNIIGFLASAEQASIVTPIDLLWSAQAACQERGLGLMAFRLPDDDLLHSGRLPQLLRSWTVDGLVINDTRQPREEVLAAIQALHLPVVWVNSAVPGAIMPDDAGAVRLLVAHLHGLGHRRIGYAGPPPDGHPSTQERLSGYREAMAGLSLAGDVVIQGEGPSWEGRLRTWLQPVTRPTAVIAYERWQALSVLLEARGLGLRVPQDLSVACVSISGFQSAGVSLTHARLPVEDMGAAAVAALVDSIAGRPVSPVAPLPLRLEPGLTSAPPPVLR